MQEWDFEREVGRKVIHLLSILYVLIYVVVDYFTSEKIALLALSFLLIILIELEYVRVELKAKIPVLSYFWKRFKRRSEHQRLGGEIFFLLGAIICFAVFDSRVAVAAILMTTFGDLAAALVGKRFGRIWIPRFKDRALEGVLAELVVNLVVGFVFLRTNAWWVGGSFGDPLWTGIIIMAVTATVVETIVNKLDDNLLVPLFAGFAGHVVPMLMGYVSF